MDDNHQRAVTELAMHQSTMDQIKAKTAEIAGNAMEGLKSLFWGGEQQVAPTQQAEPATLSISEMQQASSIAREGLETPAPDLSPSVDR